MAEDPHSGAVELTPATPLDQAFEGMSIAPDAPAARSNYYGVLSASEVFVILEKEPGESFEPKLIEMDGTRFVLAFDLEARMAAFCDKPEPYIALSGRQLIERLDGARLGLAVNAGFDSSMFLPVEVVAWIARRLGGDVAGSEAAITALNPPNLADVEVLKAIDARLATFAGPDRLAYLAEAEYADDVAHLMILTGIPEEMRTALTGAISEGLRFAAPDLKCDMLFADAGAEILETAARVGLRFDMSLPEPSGPSAPGMNPDKPPRLQ